MVPTSGHSAGFLAAIVAAALAVHASAQPSRAAPAPSPTVLLLVGGSPFNASYNQYLDAVRQSLSEWRGPSGQPCALVAEYLDLGVARDHQDYLDALRAWLTSKYADTSVNLLVTVGPEALPFAVSLRQGLWPGVPIVFAGVTPQLAASLGHIGGITGVMWDLDAVGTVNLALALFPETRRVVLLGGSSAEDLLLVGRAREQLSAFADRLAVEEITGLTVEDTVARVSHLPDDAVVLGVSFQQDASQRRLDARAVVKAVVAVVNRPVFLPTTTSLDFGGVGGSLLDVQATGRRTGQQALRILSGTPVAAVPVEPPARAVATVDWRQLQRWRVSEANIPRGTVVLHREPTLWRTYRREVIGTVTVVALLSLLTAALLVERRRRAVAESDARQQLMSASQMGRSAAMGELSASIAHELNQPLGAILNNAEAARLLLGASPCDVAAVEEALVSIRDDTARASDVIRRVRALFQKRPMVTRETDPNLLVQETLALVESEALRRRVTLVRDLSPGLPSVAADAVHLEQVLLNLLLNAMDAVEDRSLRHRAVRVATSLDGDTVQFCVSDSGPGIAADQLPRVFEPFFTTKGHGMGMGLSIARTIVDKHGGRIWVENVAGGGAAFLFTLPIWQDDAQPRSSI